MHKTALLSLPLLLATLTLSCGTEAEDATPTDTEFRVSVAVPAQLSGFEGLTVTLEPVSPCPDFWEDAIAEGIPTLTFEVGSDGLIYPNGESASATSDYDIALGESTFVNVTPGCYVVTALPTGDEGSPACLAATGTVIIERGDSLVYELAMTCTAVPRDEDEVVNTNDAPIIDELVITPNESNCEIYEVCATAHDPNFDALEFDWIQPATLGHPATLPWPNITSHTINEDDNRSVTQCIAVYAPDGPHEIDLDVYDMISPTPSTGLWRIQDVTGQESHASDAVTLDGTLGCLATGRSVVVLLTLDNQAKFDSDGVPAYGMSESDTALLIRNVVEWSSEGGDPNVLVVLDDNHHGEDHLDGEFVTEHLKSLGYAAELMAEPVYGVAAPHLEGYDLVWFVNPGYEMDDLRSHWALSEFRANGGALVLQGDDMARFRGNPEFMEPLTYLEYQGNGTVACGARTDNNRGKAYTVSFDGDATGSHPLNEGLAGTSFLYGNDVDRTRPLDRGEEVVAWATYETESCVVRTPVVVALDPDQLMPL